MQRTARRRPRFVVSADGTGIVSQAGGVLLSRTLRVTGLDDGAFRRAGAVAACPGGA